MKKSILLFLFLVLFGISGTGASDIRFRNFTSDEGLPDNSVRACMQDSYGLMWFCTRDGLCSYDGVHFKPLEDPDCDVLGGLAFAAAEDANRRIWFVTTKGIGCHDLETGETRTVHKNTGELIREADIAISRSGQVWIAADKIYCWDEMTGRLVDYGSATPFRCNALTADVNGNLWFLASDGDLYRYNNLAGTFDHVWKAPAAPGPRQDIVSDGRGHVLFSGAGGTVLSTDIQNNATKVLFRTEMNEVRAIIARMDGQYYLGTERGILVMHGDSAELLAHSTADPSSLAGEDVWTLYRDRQGNIWVGMFYNGLSLYRNQTGLVERFRSKDAGGSLAGDMVRPILQLPDSRLLVGTEDAGLSVLDPADGRTENLTLTAPDGSRLNIQGMCLSDGDVWIATFNDGVYRLNQKTLAVVNRYLPGVSAVITHRTRTGQLYAGTTTGMYRYDKASDGFAFVSETGTSFIHTFLDDSRGNLWVGTYGDGLFWGREGSLKAITSANREFGLTSNYITSLREDSRHRLWACTEGGGACYAPLDEIASGNFRFLNISRKEGLTSNIVCTVQEDLDQVIWVTTSHGIVKLHPESLSVREVYIEENGGIRNQYSYGSACATPSGRLFFGTSRGLIAFRPPARRNTVSAAPFITDISGFNKEGVSVPITQKDRSVIRTESVRVRYADLSALTLRFSVPDFQSTRSILYQTILQGGGKELVGYTTDGEATYNNLSPGRYTFQVRGLGAGRSEFRNLAIRVVPPFYRSALAYILYVLAGLTILYFLFRQWNRIRSIRLRHQVEQMETEKQKEIYDAKINFFTNITHEIRTPLSLIKMPLDKIIASGNYTDSNKQELLTMQANAERLLTLTNQLLDLRKMEKMEIKPTFLKNDLADLVRRICDRFKPVARDQHISLETDLPDTPFQVMCSAEMVEKIVGNLLSNACKYGDGQIRVALEPLPEKDSVRIRVDSNGKRITDRDAESIFEMFYQASGDPILAGKGTGLGLPFARSLAALHGGNLYLDRDVQDFNSFVLELPVHQKDQIELKPQDSAADVTDEPVTPYDSKLHTVLVVEDDPEMRGYLAKELSREYNVLLAANGEDALTKVTGQRVDLVVSDIMMPVMDGCTLCNRIKSSTELSHIPVILLTAAVGMETRIETLQAGADGYIEKPFAVELLMANIANLFKNREIANRQFTQSPLTHFNSVVTGGMDQEFMERLHTTVMEHLSEPDLNIETLTSELGTSKSTLYRKVTANTGLNINEYIRVCRLKKAAEMLSSQQYRISEVAYLTGFSSPSYFATCFQKQFNVSPSAFVKGLKG